jgi:sterol desaturase/sphingolipid hydroxylase (fatty acid hydroxylase superfamily)
MNEDTAILLILIPLIVVGILVVMFLPPLVYEISWAVGLGLSFWGMLFLLFRKRDKKGTTGAKNRG